MESCLAVDVARLGLAEIVGVGERVEEDEEELDDDLDLDEDEADEYCVELLVCGSSQLPMFASSVIVG